MLRYEMATNGLPQCNTATWLSLCQPRNSVYTRNNCQHMSLSTCNETQRSRTDFLYLQ